MFVVIKTGGKQYRAEEGDVLEIEKLQVEQGNKVTFDEVLLLNDGNKVMIGQPHVENAAVTAVVLENFKDDKIIVFKKKRRKQYKRKTGHRQQLTRIKIEKILTGKAAAETKKPAAKKEPPVIKEETVEKKAAEKAPAAKPAPAKKTTPAPKKAAPAEKAASKPKAGETKPVKKAAPKAKPAAPAKPKAAAKPAAKATKKTSEVKE